MYHMKQKSSVQRLVNTIVAQYGTITTKKQRQEIKSEENRKKKAIKIKNRSARVQVKIIRKKQQTHKWGK